MSSLSSKKGVIIGANSGIASALLEPLTQQGFSFIGTFRGDNLPSGLKSVEHFFRDLFECDFSSASSVDSCAKNIIQLNCRWDLLVFFPATMEPIGRFGDCDIENWIRSIHINLLNQLRFLHHLLPCRAPSSGEQMPLVLFFAGGGTNSAPVNFSAYTLSKIALIKAVELLDAEYADTRFAIIGPGWVKTKIHDEVLRAGSASGSAFEETLRRLESDEFVPMSKIVSCCKWLLDAPKEIVGGRNFSVANDLWGEKELEEFLIDNPDVYKLRRLGNESTK